MFRAFYRLVAARCCPHLRAAIFVWHGGIFGRSRIGSALSQELLKSGSAPLAWGAVLECLSFSGSVCRLLDAVCFCVFSTRLRSMVMCALDFLGAIYGRNLSSLSVNGNSEFRSLGGHSLQCISCDGLPKAMFGCLLDVGTFVVSFPTCLYL